VLSFIGLLSLRTLSQIVFIVLSFGALMVSQMAWLGLTPPIHQIWTIYDEPFKDINHGRLLVIFCPNWCLLERPCPTPSSYQILTPYNDTFESCLSWTRFDNFRSDPMFMNMALVVSLTTKYKLPMLNCEKVINHRHISVWPSVKGKGKGSAHPPPNMNLIFAPLQKLLTKPIHHCIIASLQYAWACKLIYPL
jgi:hypothetical protein